MSEPHTFLITFTVPAVDQPDGLAVRLYDDPHTDGMALIGPDAHDRLQVDVERAGSTFAEAVAGAVLDLVAVVPEAMIVRVEHDSLVTIAAIARRLGRQHETVRLYARGRRGPGGFPAPVGKLDAKTEVWRWPEVAAWWERAMGETVPGLRDDLFLAILNDALQIRLAFERLVIAPRELATIASVLPREIMRLGDRARVDL